ncbi:MAG: ankyrin repeat domain-containing protein [Rickettsiales bacterium]
MAVNKKITLEEYKAQLKQSLENAISDAKEHEEKEGENNAKAAISNANLELESLEDFAAEYPFHHAAGWGLMDELKEHIQLNEGNVDVYRDTSYTPLFYAAKYGRAEAVKELLENGANPNAEMYYGWTTMHAAADAEIALMLIEAGAEVNKACYDGRTPLSEINDYYYLNTPYYEKAKVLVENGAPSPCGTNTPFGEQFMIDGLCGSVNNDDGL